MVCVPKMRRVEEKIHNKHLEHHTSNQGLHQIIQATAVYVPKFLACSDASLISDAVLVLSNYSDRASSPLQFGV